MNEAHTGMAGLSPPRRAVRVLAACAVGSTFWGPTFESMIGPHAARSLIWAASSGQRRADGYRYPRLLEEALYAESFEPRDTRVERRTR
jgi:hypothetical protein